MNEPQLNCAICSSSKVGVCRNSQCLIEDGDKTRYLGSKAVLLENSQYLVSVNVCEHQRCNLFRHKLNKDYDDYTRQ